MQEIHEEAKKLERIAATKFYSKEKEKIQASRQTEADFVKFFNSTEVRQVFDDFAKPLKSLYQHYVLENTEEAGGDLLKMSGWKKLGSHFGVYPKVIPGDDFVYIFKLVTRKNTGSLVSALSEKQFQEAITRVATLGQWRLQGLP